MFFHFLTNMFKSILYFLQYFCDIQQYNVLKLTLVIFFLNQCVLKYGILQDGLIYLFIYFIFTLPKHRYSFVYSRLQVLSHFYGKNGQ